MHTTYDTWKFKYTEQYFFNTKNMALLCNSNKYTWMWMTFTNQIYKLVTLKLERGFRSPLFNFFAKENYSTYVQLLVLLVLFSLTNKLLLFTDSLPEKALELMASIKLMSVSASTNINDIRVKFRVYISIRSGLSWFESQTGFDSKLANYYIYGLWITTVMKKQSQN